MWYKAIDLDERIKKLNVLDVARDLIQNLKKDGRHFYGNCFYHISSNSHDMRFNSDDNMFYCYGCTHNGGPLTLALSSTDISKNNPHPVDYIKQKLEIDLSDKDQIKTLRRRLLFELYRFDSCYCFKEDFQDNNHLKVIENSEIPKILEKYGVNYRDVSEVKEISLLEKEAPSLCVDRFDYSIREINWNSNGLVKIIVNDLKNYKGNLVFNSKEVAESFAKGYINCQVEHWAGDESKARYYVLANILRKAIFDKILSVKDLNKFEDEHIINLLREKGDKYILDNLDLLRNDFRIEETDSDDGVILKKKFMVV